MKVARQFNQTQSLRSLTEDEAALGRKVFEVNLNYNSRDTVLLVTDELMVHQEAAIWFETARTLGLPVSVYVLAEMTHSGEEPPTEVVAAAEQASINFFQTSHSLTHTQAGKRAILNNGRGVSLPGATHDLLLKTLSIDYMPVKVLGDQLSKKLKQHHLMRITSKNGTDLTTQIRTQKIYNDCGLFSLGELGNLPAGEVFFAPLDYSTSGTLVVDGSIADDVLDKPITISIEEGVAVTISGGVAAQNLRDKLTLFGKAGLIVAEVGIGTNPAAQISNNLLEAEKAYGTVHVAFGNSSAIGGENDVPIHIDGLISEPTVYLDGEKILEQKIFHLD